MSATLIHIHDKDGETDLFFDNGLECCITWKAVDTPCSYFAAYYFTFNSCPYGLAKFKNECEWRFTDQQALVFCGPPSKEGYNCWKLKMLQ